ncbi:alanine racemase [Oceanospirillum sediminis]|uniref:Alanine racemase n=1 Tax=Oceanospirillum sediminis TaxID=2760088 RepID=A0A839IVR3_9GAMM|nr:alanine racemase [Oceanospirillum sediminis]MBB1488477.1 alanine racemase [Oceanospirillum sediminis]
MARAAKATINLAALKQNYLLAKELAGGKQAAAIIKANAYGHGAVQVARYLSDVADAFGVACIEEAMELKDAGIEQPVALLEGFFTADELELVNEHKLITAVHSDWQVEAIASTTFDQPVTVWVKFDSGMHRLGFDADGFRQALQTLKELPQVGQLVAMTHYACADEVECEYTQQQLNKFLAVCADYDLPVCTANSAAILHWPETHGKNTCTDWVRPGIMLYGASPMDQNTENSQRLQTVMTLSSALIAVRELEPGEPIGYGRRFVTEQPTRVGVVAMGYADGYPRHAKDGTPVAVNDKMTRIIGKVSMDMMTVDLTDLPDAQIGDPVELWGEQVDVNDVASCADTIAYTLYTGITRRVPLVYKS